jgi:hypothetical protein
MKICELLEAKEYSDSRHLLAALNSSLSIQQVANSIDEIINNVTASNVKKR